MPSPLRQGAFASPHARAGSAIPRSPAPAGARPQDTRGVRAEGGAPRVHDFAGVRGLFREDRPAGPMSRKKVYELAQCVPEGEIDPEIGDKLDAIAAVAESAQPVGGG